MDDAVLQRIGKALGMIPSGCGILTVTDGDFRTGMLTSWIQQAGFDPPAVSIAVKKGRPIEPLIDRTGRFVLNLIGEDPRAMFRHFGRGFEPDEDAFAGLKISTQDGGVALEDAIAILSCRVAGKFDAGDHWLYVGRVENATTRDGARSYVHLRKSGLTY